MLVTGLYQGDLTLGPDPNHNHPNLGLRDIFIAKYSNYDGDMLWSKVEGGTDNDFSLAISNDTEGHTKYAGCFFGTSTIDGSTNTALGSSDLFVADVSDGETGSNGSIFYGDFSLIKHPSCKGRSDGCVVLEVFGGVAPHTYSWSTGASTNNLSSLSAGLYQITVEDAGGYSFSKQLLIEDPVYQENTWIGPTAGLWNESSSFWSRGLMPEECDNLIIPGGHKISLQSGQFAECNTLYVSIDAVFVAEEGSILNVHNPD